MALQIILLIVYGLIAWTLGVVAARAYYNIIYLKANGAACATTSTEWKCVTSRHT